ncbi:MAG: preprotein translocase subunit SecG [Candidatus Gracilibacteria bacterium]|nr:preprotein translocase subunit SecG [Candidatus Gracilibacteria bacterium]
MTYILSLLSVIVILLVMMQAKGSGLSIIPNSNDFGKFERRGPEKILHNITMGIIIAFIVTALIAYFIG